MQEGNSIEEHPGKHTLTKKGRLVNAAWYEIVNHISLYTPFVTWNMGNAPSNL